MRSLTGRGVAELVLVCTIVVLAACLTIERGNSATLAHALEAEISEPRPW